jgi:hypothetical protein
MSATIQISSDGLNKKLAMAKIAFDKAVRIAVKEAARDVQEEAKRNHRFTPRSGALEKSVKTRSINTILIPALLRTQE